MIVQSITESDKLTIKEFVTSNWGSPVMVSRGFVHRIDELPGFVALADNKIVGLITYHLTGDDCEIVSLDSLIENQGIGGQLVESVLKAAKENHCRRVWLITSNDNLHAMRFYQKRGFDMVALHVNAINEARRIKPEIPLVSNDGIPISHEVEFEWKLSHSSMN